MSGYLHQPAARENIPAYRFSAPESSSRLTPEQRDQWTAMVNLSQHPMLVMDDCFRPIVLNEALRRRLSDPTVAPGTDQPVAFLWQRLCEAVGRVVADAATTGAVEFAEVIPMQRCGFAAIGSILRKDGRIVGAIINLGQATTPSAEASSGEADDLESRRAFDEWSARREQARQKMSRLSRRESQVVSLVSDGLPNKSIAKALDISVKTIEKHRANATRKLGVGSTAEMVRISVVAEGKGPDVEPPALNVPPMPYFPTMH